MIRLLTFNFQSHRDKNFEVAFGLKQCGPLSDSDEKNLSRLKMFNKTSLLLIFNNCQKFREQLLRLHQMGFQLSIVIHPDEMLIEEVGIFLRQYCETIYVGITECSQLHPIFEKNLSNELDYKILFIAQKLLRNANVSDFEKRNKLAGISYSVYAPMHYGQCLQNHQLGALLTSLERTFGYPPEDFSLESLIDLHRSEDLQPFPDISPQFVFNDHLKPEFSVIIPSYNNWLYLQKTLLNLFANNLEGPIHEVIIVDDGSDDQTPFEMEEFAKKNCSKSTAFKYIYFKRVLRRSMGDGQFRAGIARNLGALHSTSPYIGFLDSDVLTPPGYIARIISELNFYDVVQTRRHDLSHQSSIEKTYYNEFFEDDLIFDDEYWNSFHRTDQPWQNMVNRWKYVCTHSLNLRRSLFDELRGIRPSYNFYGFEDTDLGYRLAKKEKVFHLSSIETFHLYHRPDRSEFSRKKHMRAKLLKKTCEIFFRHNPTLENYRIFSSMLP